jgi:uncharacterized protein YggE
MKIFITLLLVHLSTIANLHATEIKGTPEELKAFLFPDKKVVSLSADVERRVYADQAIVSVVVKNEAKTLSNAMQANAKLRDTLKKRLIESGLAADNIQNSQFSSSPQYGWFGDEPKSFEVINRVAVKISDESALQALASITDQFKEMTISGTEYKHTQKESVYEDMKKEALDKILANKRYYESSLDVVLNTANFYDSGLQINATAGARDVEIIEVKAKRLQEADLSYSSAVRRPKATSSFEEIEYTITMRVEFEIN